MAAASTYPSLRTRPSPKSSAVDKVRCLASAVATRPPRNASQSVTCCSHAAPPGTWSPRTARPSVSLKGRTAAAQSATTSSAASTRRTKDNGSGGAKGSDSDTAGSVVNARGSTRGRVLLAELVPVSHGLVERLGGHDGPAHLREERLRELLPLRLLRSRHRHRVEA